VRKIVLAFKIGVLPAILVGVLFGIFTWFSNPAVGIIYFVIVGGLVGIFIGALLFPLTWFLIGIGERRSKSQARTILEKKDKNPAEINSLIEHLKKFGDEESAALISKLQQLRDS
jgi:xanthosine utilization system XapX-like protein